MKSYFELKGIYHYLLQDQKWQSVGTKVLHVYIQKKDSFISIHSELTWVQLLKRWIKVSSCNLQKEHKGEGDFPKWNSILLRYNTLSSILYWNALKLVLLLILLGRRYINFQFEFGNKELKFFYEMGMLLFLEINIKYNSFKVIFSKLRSKLFLI